jgi:SAM-dependent methyltransferase
VRGRSDSSTGWAGCRHVYHPCVNHRREWDEIGSLDPLWAILSAPEKRYGSWDVEEFLDTGRREIEGVLERGGHWQLPVEHGKALDFGCGVGRLTRALAAHFDSALGVDLSEVMVRSARQLHRDATNPSFQALADAPLSGLRDHTFDFIYSNLVLQHMRDHRIIEATVVDFVRLLKTGGLLVFQLPSSIPLRRRVQVRPRLYTALRAVGVPHATLYRRLGLHPIRMTGIEEPKVARLLEEAGGTVLAVDRRVLANTGIEDRIFYVTLT